MAKGFLRNCWYAAAWHDEVQGRETLARTILGEEILFWRADDGTAHAMANRCPHRFAPLSEGTHLGNSIACPYHGLEFGRAGQCVRNPQGDIIPPNARVNSYPVHEQALLLWIWMGAPAEADPNLIPEFAGMDPDSNAINKGYLHTPANYELMSDNILDLGHIEFLHGDILGSEAVRRASTEARVEGTTVWSIRETENEILPGPLAETYSMGAEPCRRRLEVRWNAPGLLQLRVSAWPMDGSRPPLETPGVHIMTPETEHSTHYFWSNSRNFRLDDDTLHNALQEGLAYAFEYQDKPMIVAQQEVLGDRDLLEAEPVILRSDAAAIRARRLLAKLIREEAA